MTIKGVFFDMGGVLRTEDLAGRRKWEGRFGLADWGLAEAVFNNNTSRRASVGQAQVDEIWQHIAGRYELNPDELAELRGDFWHGDRFDEPLLRYIAALRPRYRTGLITNAWLDAREFLSQHDFIAAAFEKLFVSAEIGIAKPDPRIYQLALDDFGLKPEEAVFVDDVPLNVEAAQALGMAGIVYRAGMDVPQALADLGVK